MKILAVASNGGHWVQLLRITRSMPHLEEIIYASTHEDCAKKVDGHQFYKITDFSRKDFCRLIIPVFYRAFRIISKTKPSVVITTGAAPGLIIIFVAKLFGVKTVWIDSIANVSVLSMSGRIASRFATRTYTQWEELANDRVLFAGNILE